MEPKPHAKPVPFESPPPGFTFGGVPAREPMPSNYSDFDHQSSTDEQGYVVFDTARITTGLREDLNDPNYRPAVAIGTAYAVVREIGDNAVKNLQQQSSGSHDALTLLDMTRRDSHPNKIVIDEKGDELNGADGMYYQKVLYAAPHLFDAAHDRGYASRLSKVGVKLHDPGDARLIRVTSIVAHEAAHAITNSISKKLEYDRDVHWFSDDHHFVATEAYMVNHPEQAITGKWGNDTLNHEERFAEGYRRLVVDTMLTSLGYDEGERGIILRDAQYRADFEGKQNENQIDHMSYEVGNVALMSQVMPVELSALQKNDGALGYALPLTPSEVVGMLDELAQRVKTGEPVPDMHPRKWAKMVRQTPKAPAEAAYAQELFEGRAKVLGVEPPVKPEVVKTVERRGKILRRLMGGLLVGAVAAGTLAAVSESTNADRRSQTSVSSEQDLQKTFDDYNKNHQFTVETGDPGNPSGDR